MVAILGLDPVVLLKGGPEGLQPYTAYGSWATHNLQSTRAAAELLPWLARGALGAPQGAALSEQLSSSLPSRPPRHRGRKRSMQGSRRDAPSGCKASFRN